MNTLNKIKQTLVLLGLSCTSSFAGNVASSDYDFSVEHSIWGAGPVRNIEPEIKKETNNGQNESIITPFEKFDLSDLEADQDKRRKELMKKLMKERTVRTTLPFFTDESHSHLGLSLTGGVSNLITKSSFGETKGGFTPGFLIDYYYFFNQNWGARIGLGLTLSNCRFKNKGIFKDSTNYIDFEGDSVALGYRVKSIDEKFTTVMLEVPLMAAYTQNDWLFAAGFKFGFPLSIRYDQKMDGVDITGYYNFTDPIYSAKALGTIQNGTFRKKGSFSETPIYAMIGANIGRKFRINDMFDFGVSAYIDYSLNGLEMRMKNDKANYQDDKSPFYLIRNEELITEDILTREDPGAKTKTSSSLCSQRIEDGKKIIERVKYFDAGLKISIYFSSYANGTKEAREEIERKVALMQ